MAHTADGYLGRKLRKIDPGFALKHALRRARLRLGAAEWPAPRLDRPVFLSPQAVLHTQLACPDLPATAPGRFPTAAIGTRVGGDWDRAIARIDGTLIYKGLHQRFVEGRDWEATCLHPARYREENPKGRERYSRFGEDEFRARAAFLDRLYRSMASEGWVIGKRKRLVFPAIPDVLLCNLTRDGLLVRNSGGLHRLVISQLAGLDRVPVLFAVVHKDWSLRRGFVRTGEERVPA